MRVVPGWEGEAAHAARLLSTLCQGIDGGMLPGMALGWSHPEDGNSWAHQTHDGLRVKLNDLAH